MHLTRSRLLSACVLAMGLVVGADSLLLAGEPKPSQLEAQGIEAMGVGNYEQAEQIFRDLIELRPGSFVGHYNLGSALSMQGDGDGAVAEISAAITLG
ncbi:MAG: hypothetical protein ACWA5W_10315, partial [Phycisphaerales bacterium]